FFDLISRHFLIVHTKHAPLILIITDIRLKIDVNRRKRFVLLFSMCYYEITDVNRRIGGGEMLIAGYRKMTGRTQAEMTKKIGISEGTYRNKENGKARFKDNEMEIFYKLVQEINPAVDVSAIFFNDTAPKKDELKEAK